MDIKLNISTDIDNSDGWELTDFAVYFHKNSGDAGSEPFLCASLMFENETHRLETNVGPVDTAIELEDRIKAVRTAMEDIPMLLIEDFDMDFKWTAKTPELKDEGK